MNMHCVLQDVTISMGFFIYGMEGNWNQANAIFGNP